MLDLVLYIVFYLSKLKDIKLFVLLCKVISILQVKHFDQFMEFDYPKMIGNILILHV